jgi:hypothetical protein
MLHEKVTSGLLCLPRSNDMKRILNEPLLHFLLLGVAIFVAYGLVKPSSEEPGKIVITQGQLATMIESFNLTRQRPPIREEWEGLIRERVRQEIYYREALALGLDKDDVIIRRRLQQKMEFVSDDVAAQALPTDDELGAYLTAHPDKFRLEQQFTFRQLYLDPEKHGANLARDAAQLLAKLNRAGGGTGLATMADPFMLDRNFTAVPASEVARQFGETFASKLAEIASGQWQMIESGYGVHLVLVSERREGHLPPLEDVRDAVRREWESNRRREVSEKRYETMLKRYVVTIERPEFVDNKKRLTEAK